MKAIQKIMASALALTMAASIGVAALADGENIATSSNSTAKTEVTISSAKVVKEETKTTEGKKLPVYETETITDKDGKTYTIIKTDKSGNPIAKTDEKGNIIYRTDDGNNKVDDYKYKETEITIIDENGKEKKITVILVDEDGNPEADLKDDKKQELGENETRTVTTVTETKETEKPVFSVTLPTTMAMAIDANGNTAAGNFTIENGSAGPVKVTNISVTGDKWSLASFGDDFASKQVNSRQLGLQLSVSYTKDEETITGTAATAKASAKGEEQALTINNPTAWTIARNNSLDVTTAAKTTAVSEAITTPETAANIVFTVGWDD